MIFSQAFLLLRSRFLYMYALMAIRWINRIFFRNFLFRTNSYSNVRTRQKRLFIYGLHIAAHRFQKNDVSVLHTLSFSRYKFKRVFVLFATKLTIYETKMENSITHSHLSKLVFIIRSLVSGNCALILQMFYVSEHQPRKETFMSHCYYD